MEAPKARERSKSKTADKAKKSSSRESKEPRKARPAEKEERPARKSSKDKAKEPAKTRSLRPSDAKKPVKDEAKVRTSSKDRLPVKEKSARTSSKDKAASKEEKPKRTSSKDRSASKDPKEKRAVKPRLGKDEEKKEKKKRVKKAEEAHPPKMKTPVPSVDEDGTPRDPTPAHVVSAEPSPRPLTPPTNGVHSPANGVHSPANGVAAAAGPAAAELKEDDDYGDDFEDYDDDFESAAEQDENEDPAPPTPRRSLDDDVGNSHGPATSQEELTPESSPEPIARRAAEQKRPDSKSSRINFATASVPISGDQVAALDGASSRAKEILKLVELDAVTSELFQLLPIKDYEYFMQNFGGTAAARVQVVTQTGEDRVDREEETEEIETAAMWTQAPATDSKGVGGDSALISFDERVDSELYNSDRFKRFIKRSGKLLLEMLEEDVDAAAPPIERKTGSKFSVGSFSLSLGALASKCSVLALEFNPDKPNMLLVSFNVEESIASDIVACGFLVLWNINVPDKPQKVLICESPSRAVGVGSVGGGGVAVAGLADGSVVAWDLEEAAEDGPSLPWGSKGEMPLKAPSYDTSFLSAEAGGGPPGRAASPIVGVALGAEAAAFLEESGPLHIWGLRRVAAAWTDADLGVGPHSRLRLVPTHTIRPDPFALRCLASDGLGLRVCCVGAQGEDAFLVGTDAAYVLLYSRHGAAAGPKAFSTPLDAISTVTSIDVSPFDVEVFAAAFSDGFVRVFRGSESRPLTELRLEDSKDAILSVAWARTHSTGILALTAAGRLWLWELGGSGTAEKVGHFSGLALSAPTSAASFMDKFSFEALGGEDGHVEVHRLIVVKPSHELAEILLTL